MASLTVTAPANDTNPVTLIGAFWGKWAGSNKCVTEPTDKLPVVMVAVEGTVSKPLMDMEPKDDMVARSPTFKLPVTDAALEESTTVALEPTIRSPNILTVAALI